MTWFPLHGDERLGRCATEGCGQQPTFRLEADGFGSNYCSACTARIGEGDLTVRLLEVALTGRVSVNDPHVIADAQDQIERLRRANVAARAQLHAVHSVYQVPFLKGAIGAALQALESIHPST